MSNRNRNWDRNWSQGNGRSAYDYGRTGPIEPLESTGGEVFCMILASAIGGLVLALMFFAWIG